MIISLIAVIAVIIILLVLIRNRKDEEQLEEKLKQDYHKPKKRDVEADERESVWSGKNFYNNN